MKVKQPMVLSKPVRLFCIFALSPLCLKASRLELICGIVKCGKVGSLRMLFL